MANGTGLHGVKTPARVLISHPKARLFPEVLGEVNFRSFGRLGATISFS
jgi:hypothetical protein